MFANDATRPERNSDHDMPVGYFKFPKAATTTVVSDASAGFSATDQSVTLTANVTGPASISEGTVTFTVRNSATTLLVCRWLETCLVEWQRRTTFCRVERRRKR